MVKDIIKYNEKEYQLSTVFIENMALFETMIFQIKNGTVSGKEVYCFRTADAGKSKDKHIDIYYHPEKYLSDEIIDEYLKSKEDLYDGDGSKIYIVNGYEYTDDSCNEEIWVEELFLDAEQANACCVYLNVTNTKKNVTYYISEYNGFCNEDYVSKLEEIYPKR